MSELTHLLDTAGKGDPVAGEQLFVLVYSELRRLAAAKMAKEAAGHTLQATALVHEAWMRLGGQDQQQWKNRAHFFGAAAEAMRRILIDRSRRKLAARHGAGQTHLDAAELEIAAPAKDDELLAVHETLDRLAAHDPEKAELVKLRYFAGFTMEEAAEVLGIPVHTAKRHWAYARAWLYRAMDRQSP
jgi:RNA polymerase sigma factor (TIGR02999 family)